jgi:hypothetical protein
MGPGVVKPLPVQQAPGSTSVDDHCRSPSGTSRYFRSEVFAGYLLLSVVSASAANMMRSEGELVRLSSSRVVHQMTADKSPYVFTNSTVPAIGPRKSEAFGPRSELCTPSPLSLVGLHRGEGRNGEAARARLSAEKRLARDSKALAAS